MSAQTRAIWPVVVVLGAVFALLNLGELVFLESGGSEVVGLAIGIGATFVGVAMARGWPGGSA